VKGNLLQNTEFGHLLVNQDEAEVYASAAVKRIEKLTWKQWATRFNEVLKVYEFLLNPDIFILGGGVSARFEKYSRYLTVSTKVVPAKLENLAGIVGAAMAAKESLL
jgi:polyphosphate glucokinase